MSCADPSSGSVNTFETCMLFKIIQPCQSRKSSRALHISFDTVADWETTKLILVLG